jgi:ribosomal protein S18 acetylase RimI-like enzyme
LQKEIDKMGCIEIRNAVDTENDAIHEILSEAFKPYRECYTEQAYGITICSPEEIGQRIDDSMTDVLVAVYEDQIVGTATLHLREKGKLYLSSMAVIPATQGKGVGYYLLQAVERRAKEKNCTVISLECCEFLRMAIGLYKRMGYKRTGRKRPYYGVEVFEMQKLM